MARQQADPTPDRCSECGTVGEVYRTLGTMLCAECAQLRREDMERDYATMDVVDAMALMGGSRTWA
jgi:hypothetical protein